jgi:two-component system, CitB family, sensor kinase
VRFADGAADRGCVPCRLEVSRLRRRATLSGQLLALQLLIVLGVLAGVTAVSIAQSGAAIRTTETRRALSAAENVASTGLVRAQLPTATAADPASLTAAAETSRTLSGAASVLLITTDGTILTSADPGQVGTRMVWGDPQVLQGKSWTGLVETSSGTRVSAQVPVFATQAGRIVGYAAVEREYPSVLDRLGQAVPNLITYLGIAGGLGIAGSLLLTRRVKRQTLGLEPQEITRLVEHREATLHGIKEGLIALSPDERITLANDSACQLLGIPYGSVGSRLDELGLDPHLAAVLTGRTTGTDQVVLVEDRVLTLNRKAVSAHGRELGSVTTLRDRTELATLQRELGIVRDATDTLRAQTHEFANQLHVISGLVQLHEYDEVVRFIEAVVKGRAALDQDVTSRVLDPALAALLVAKASLAAERNVVLRLADGAALDRVDDQLSVDLTTVVGNLVDNALDAVSAVDDGEAVPGWVEVDLCEDVSDVVVVVRDSGPGVETGIAHQVFDKGFSTKASGDDVGRGFGLALTGLVCRRRGGDVSVRNEQGAVFTARLPRQDARA